MSYTDKRTLWDADIHLLSTYAFLSQSENRLFASREQKYLIKEVYEKNFYNVAGTQKVEVESLGMVANWTFYLQRNDVFTRNEWSNYTNWPYDYLPYDVVPADQSGGYLPPGHVPGTDCSLLPYSYTGLGPGMEWSDSDPSGWVNTNIYITPKYNPQNERLILSDMGILLDGKYRENTMKGSVYNYIDKYVRCSGQGKDSVYFYNYGLHTDPFDFQPSGAINMSKFSNVELEFTTIPPPLDPSAQFYTICDANGDLIGVNKTNWELYKYNYTMTLFEERYNVVTFAAGNAGLMYAR